jgi:hypothetical protein
MGAEICRPGGFFAEFLSVLWGSGLWARDGMQGATNPSARMSGAAMQAK